MPRHNLRSIVFSVGLLVVATAGITLAADSTPSAVLPPEVAKVVPRSEQQVTVVFTDRIVNYSTSAIRARRFECTPPWNFPSKQ